MFCFVWLALGFRPLLPAEPLLLEPSQYSVHQWGSADGLPEEQIFGFAQTPDGFLWLATAYGMVRFDGQKFTVFHPQNYETATSSVMIVARPEGPSDLTVWSRDGTNFRFRDGRYELLARGNGARFPLPDYMHFAKKSLWVPGDPAWFSAPKSVPILDSLRPGEKVTAWTQDALGTQWFGTNKGRAIERFRDALTILQPPGLASDGHIVRIIHSGGRLSIGTTGGYYEVENGNWHRYSAEMVTSLLRDGEGRIWAGTSVGLAVCDQGRWFLFRKQHGLPEESVFATFLDSEGNVWASFEKTGLFRIKPPRIPSFGENQGLITDRLLGFLQTSSGLWAAGDTAVDHINGEKRTRMALPPAPRRVRSLLEDENRHVWISTSNHVFRVHPETHAMVSIPADPSLGFYHSLFRSREGEMWMVHSKGLARYDGRRFMPYPISNLARMPLPMRVAMAQTADGRLWLSARDRGLYQIDGNRLTSILPDDERMKLIHLMYADGDDLWLGFDGEGLGRYRNGKLSVYPVLPNGTGHVYGLAEDASGNFWIGLRSLLISLKKSDLNRYLDGAAASVTQNSFDSTDGFNSANFGLTYTPVNAAKTPVVWMSTLQGLIRIDSQRIRPNPVPPVITFREFVADKGKPLKLVNGILQVPADVETFRVAAEAPSLTEASKVRFRRKLEGYDRDWLAYEGGITSFTKLPPGEYTLRVTACNSDGVWSETGSSLRIVKMPAFYQAWWFYFLSTCAAAAAGYMMIRWWTRLLRRRNEELEWHVSVRTEELEKAKLAAEAAAQTKADFLATMSHEIRTPMHGVLGTLDLLAATTLSPEQRDYVNTISQSSNTLLALLNDVLDLSKLEAGRMELRNAPFSVRTIASHVARPFEAAARLKNLAFEVWIDPALPQYLLGDTPRIRQVLFNLVGNAVKFTDRGKVELRIEGKPSREGYWAISFSVTDTGIGIPEEHVGSLFEKFRQVDGSSTRRHGGTGLGLAICRRLADLMKGSLTVESGLGKGSKFCLSVELEETNRAPAADSLIDAELNPNRYRGRVLLVEDNAINRRLAQALLEKLGCQVETANNGLEAVAKVGASTYDLVLMDCQMPEMDGIEATREIRSRNGHSRPPVIVAVTANAMEGDRERCVEAGMNDYLAKPFQLRDLIELLDRYLKQVQPATLQPLETVFKIDSPQRAC